MRLAPAPAAGTDGAHGGHTRHQWWGSHGWSWSPGQWCNEHEKIFIIWRFWTKHPSSSSVLLSKNLINYEDFKFLNFQFFLSLLNVDPSKIFEEILIFEDFSNSWRIFIFGLFSESKDYLSSSSVHLQSSLQHCTNATGPVHLRGGSRLRRRMTVSFLGTSINSVFVAQVWKGNFYGDERMSVQFNWIYQSFYWLLNL